ncbi:hypothetical protein GGI12_004847 [Dipsacomyces acuminosporus]|nr:hypothetical protein GGI12_004847 [Dipsacomyces acuminosporus]
MAVLETPLVTLTKPRPSSPHVYLLQLHHKIDNRVTIELIQDINRCLDTIEAELDKATDSKTGGALVLTGHGKFFSNGFSIEQLDSKPKIGAKSVGIRQQYLLLLARLLLFRVPTVGALNGHTFAAGCMIALALDYRVMRKDRGFICMNEVDIGRQLAPGMAALIKEKIKSPNTLRDCVLGGKRFTAEDAKASGIVDAVVEQSKVVEAALDIAEKHTHKAKGQNYHLLKAELYRDAVPYMTASPSLLPGEGMAKL